MTNPDEEAEVHCRAALGRAGNRRAEVPSNDTFVVAFRTHLWSPLIADMALRLEAMAASCRFVIVADMTVSQLPIRQFETISHNDDFSAFGLPSFPSKQVLWYNADYPLYLLAKRFPNTSHFAMVEYDVGVNLPLFPILSEARSKRLDLIAHYIHAADPHWEWTPLIKSHFMNPFQAFLPFMIISARAVQKLLKRRLATPSSNLKEFSDWPFCEAFIPSALFEMDEVRTEELSVFADLKHYTLDATLHPNNPLARKAGSIVHKIGATSNLALGKPATQSSVHPWWNAESVEADACRGNDGRRGRTEGFNTAAEDNAWWQVDLLEEYEISRLVIYDRIDAPSIGTKLRVLTSLDRQSWEPQATFCLTDELSIIFPNSVKSRYLRIIRLDFGELHLDEIEVYSS